MHHPKVHLNFGVLFYIILHLFIGCKEKVVLCLA